jgi:hypothetical protein
MGGERRRRTVGKFLGAGEVPDEDRMDDEEGQSRNRGDPDQDPRNMDGNRLSPGIDGPL